MKSIMRHRIGLNLDREHVPELMLGDCTMSNLMIGSNTRERGYAPPNLYNRNRYSIDGEVESCRLAQEIFNRGRRVVICWQCGGEGHIRQLQAIAFEKRTSSQKGTH